MKTCTDCGETKPEADFYERKKGTGKRQAHCKVCAATRARRWAEENPERFREYHQEYRVKNRDQRARNQEAYRQRIKATPGARWEQIKKAPHTLYRLFDGEGVLLYVGITSCFDYRMRRHAETKDWWPQVVRIEREEFPDRTSADSSETKVIRSENPRFNIRKR